MLAVTVNIAYAGIQWSGTDENNITADVLWPYSSYSSGGSYNTSRTYSLDTARTYWIEIDGAPNSGQTRWYLDYYGDESVIDEDGHSSWAGDPSFGFKFTKDGFYVVMAKVYNGSLTQTIRFFFRVGNPVPNLPSNSPFVLQAGAQNGQSGITVYPGNISNWSVVRHSGDAWMWFEYSDYPDQTTCAIYANPNETANNRSCGFTFTFGTFEEYLYFRQTGADPSISVDPTSANLSYNDTYEHTFEVSSTISWQSYVDKNWVHLLTTSGNAGSTTARLWLDANDSSSPRTATISVENTSYGIKKTLILTQEGVPIPIYTITTASSPAAGGTTSGGGSKQSGSSCTVTASAAGGYTFSNWTEGGTVVSASASYEFTVTGPRTLTANFSQQTATITVSASPSNGGTVSGGGTYAVGSSREISATANSGWGFAGWSDGNASNPRTVTVPAGGASYTANFSQQTATITVSASPSNGGTVSGGGTKASGSSCTVTATANSGYTFSNWTEVGTVVSASASYTFTVTGPRTLTANFTVVGQTTPVVSVTPITRYVTKDAGTTTFNVTNSGSGTMTWTAAVSSGGTWARITSGASGSNAGTVTVGYDANPAGGAARTATIRVTATGAAGNPADVTVVQTSNTGVGTEGQDDFESYVLNTWPSRWAADGNASDAANNKVVTDPTGGANKVLKLYGVLGGFWGALGYLPCSIPNDFTLEVRVFNGTETIPSSGHQSRCGVGLRKGTYWGNYGRGLISFDKNGNATRIDGTVIGQYTLGIWHQIKVQYQRKATSITVTYWMNGVAAGSASQTLTDVAGENSQDHIDLSVNAGSGYFDDVVLTTASAPVTISTVSPLASGMVGLAYSQTLAASGGTMPYSWSVASGSLPSGLSLSPNGVISGTPNAANTYTFTLRVTAVGEVSVTKNFSLTVTQNSNETTSKLSVTPTIMYVVKVVGTTPFSILNAGSGTMTWTAAVTSGGAWARIISGASGINAGTVTVGYDANPAGGAARTATIRVTAMGASDSPVDVKVTQEANWVEGGSSLPNWAWGTFNGYIEGGMASMAVTATGKITGKMSFGSVTYSFNASSYTSRNDEDGYVITAEAKSSGKVTLPVTLNVYAPAIWDDTGTLPRTLGVADGDIGGERVCMLYRNVWKDAGLAATLNDYIGYYTATLPGEFGSGYLTFTVDKTGQVKIAGKLADGTSVSSSCTLILDGDGLLWALMYTAPTTYKGGYFLLGAQFVRPPNGKVFLRLYNFGEWVTRNPQASENYGEEWWLSVDLVGGWYDKLIDLYSHYGNGLRVDSSLPDLPVTTKYTDWGDDGRKVSWPEPGLAGAADAASPAGLVLNLNTAGTGFIVPKADKLVKDTETGEYYYGEDTDGDGKVNTAGLTFSFTQATGLFKGSFKTWYDYESSVDNTTETIKYTHTSKNVTFQGALTPVREEMTNGIAGRGFYLCPAKGSYEDAAGKTKTYNFNRSYDFLLLGN